MTTVHDLSKEILKISIWNLLVVGKVVMEDISADSEITIIEVVFSRPSLSSELSSTKNERVEHAESEQESFVLIQFVRLGSLEVRFVEFTESSSDVRLKILRGLIGYLKRVLEDRLWNNFLVW